MVTIITPPHALHVLKLKDAYTVKMKHNVFIVNKVTSFRKCNAFYAANQFLAVLPAMIDQYAYLVSVILN